MYRGGVQGAAQPTHQSHRAHRAGGGQDRESRRRQHSHATHTQRTTGQGSRHSTQGRHGRKNKRVHKSTFKCAMMVAWSTRGQTRRSHPTTPLAPLREDAPRHQPRQRPLFDAGGAGASRRYYPESKFDAGRGRRGFFPDKIKNKFSISLRKAGKEAWKWIRN